MFQMSWTCRVKHPSEVVEVGQVEVVILEIDHEVEISLGIKQTEVNPWELVSRSIRWVPPLSSNSQHRQLRAFVEIEPGIDGLLHVSDMSWTEKVAHPNEKYQKATPSNAWFSKSTDTSNVLVSA